MQCLQKSIEKLRFWLTIKNNENNRYGEVQAMSIWGISSVGRALHLQCKGQGFESLMLHYL